MNELIDKNELLEKIEELEAQNNCGTSDFIEAKRIAFRQVKESLDSIEVMTLQEGEYIIPDGLSIKKVGKILKVYKSKSSRLTAGEYRCKDCKHYVNGFSTKNAWYETKICELICKRTNKDGRPCYKAVNKYGKTCEHFELKEKQQ